MVFTIMYNILILYTQWCPLPGGIYLPLQSGGLRHWLHTCKYSVITGTPNVTTSLPHFRPWPTHDPHTSQHTPHYHTTSSYHTPKYRTSHRNITPARPALPTHTTVPWGPCNKEKAIEELTDEREMDWRIVPQRLQLECNEMERILIDRRIF
jgi:hypothetical protein